jgi:tRNA (guanine-N7-)-methyltransferase
MVDPVNPARSDDDVHRRATRNGNDDNDIDGNDVDGNDVDGRNRDGDDGDDSDGDDGDEDAAPGAGVDPASLHARMPRVLPTLLPGRPSWSTVFGREAPLEVELGFGRPHFLLERAAEVPEHDVVGIEWKGRWPAAVHAQQARGRHPNVRAIHGNAWLLLGSLFAPASLTWIVLNFPDPWWKSKHQKRRIVSDAFARLLASRLAPGGRILVQTDVASLLEEFLTRLEAQPTLRNTAGPFRLAPRKPMTASSHREKRCRRDGVPIFRAVLARVDDAAAAP